MKVHPKYLFPLGLAATLLWSVAMLWLGAYTINSVEQTAYRVAAFLSFLMGGLIGNCVILYMFMQWERGQ